MEAGLGQLHLLTTKIQTPKKGKLDTDKAVVTFTYEHDRFDFQIELFDDRFRIAKSDSSFDNFYEWYYHLMPRAAAIESTLRRVIERTANKPLTVVQTAFDFTIYFGDFKQLGRKTSDRLRNVDVLQTLINSLPDEHGEMREIPKQNFYRLDLTLSRLETFSGGKTRQAWYFLQAPANENGRYLVLRGQLRNASTERPGTDSHKPADVLPFDPDHGEDYKIALTEFLRDRALEGFARRLLENWEFITARTM
jgi:hypothetical protein